MEFDWTQGALAEGLRSYHAGEYFTAHEAWETVWLEAQEPDRTFLQGLIQGNRRVPSPPTYNPVGTGRLLNAPHAITPLDGIRDELGPGVKGNYAAAEIGNAAVHAASVIRCSSCGCWQ
jgi:Domain of unknown function (DUF309)